MKKPDILSDEEIEEVIGKRTTERYLARHATDAEARAVAQKALDDCYKEMLGQLLDNLNKLYKQYATDMDWGQYLLGIAELRQNIQSQLEE